MSWVFDFIEKVLSNDSASEDYIVFLRIYINIYIYIYIYTYSNDGFHDQHCSCHFENKYFDSSELVILYGF